MPPKRIKGSEEEKTAEPEDKFRKPFRSPYKIYMDYRARKKIEEEDRLLKREEQMKQDLESFLMELEERRTWAAYELHERNLQFMLRREQVAKLKRKEDVIEQKRRDEAEIETGLSFYRGDIISYKRWQNSPAKHLDITGHMSAVYSVKMSKCLKYLVSCSADKTVRLWKTMSGKCLLMYNGHTKRVTDCDIHPHFEIDSKQPWIVSCSVNFRIVLFMKISLISKPNTRL